MELEVGEALQHEAEGGQPGPGVDRLRLAGGVDSGVGRVAGGQGLGVVPVEAVDHPVDEGGGVHQRSSLRGRGYQGGRRYTGAPYIHLAQGTVSTIFSRILVNVRIGSSSRRFLLVERSHPRPGARVGGIP
jgi:hypothetical protein